MTYRASFELARPQHLDDLLAGAGVGLNDEMLDQIDEVVAPGTNAGPVGAVYEPPAVTTASPIPAARPSRKVRRPTSRAPS